MLQILVTVLIASLIAVIILIWFYQRWVNHLKGMIHLTETKLIHEGKNKEILLKNLKEVKDKFTHDLLYDSLTGLPGKRVFADRIEQTIIQNRRNKIHFALLYLDLDEFKNINDALGYDVGDALLLEVAKRLKDIVREADSICRFAGDEFILILQHLNKPENAAYVAQRILETLRNPFQVCDHDLYITGSIGIATFPCDGETEKDLFKNAHAAMHQAKARGRNTYQFYRSEVHKLGERELKLSSSLKEDSLFENLIVFYQPQLNLQTKKMTGMEALLHWNHPDFGLLPLSEFGKLAENNSRIIEMSEWLLHHAFQQFVKWKTSQFPVNTLIINISLREIESPRFAYKLSLLFRELNIDPASLILEISEKVLPAKLDFFEKSLNMLKHLGTQISIKDFGAGQLSLRHLKTLPIDYLKINSTLVKEITIDNNSLDIVKMAVGLAKNLQITAVAEGVESIKQKEILQEMGCFVMQGSLFSMPLRVEEWSKEKINALTAIV